jgi:caffeoyl-CoA O-methyltransferase
MLISSDQAEFYRILMKITNCKLGIEVGTFTGFSGLSFAMGLPENGKLISLDVSEEYTSLAKEYWKKANVSHKIDLRIGVATDILNDLIEEKEGGFDFVFIDADKKNT